MGDYLCADLYELELNAGKRPVGHLTREREPAQEVAKVVGQHEQGEAHPVGGETDSGGVAAGLERILTESQETAVGLPGQPKYPPNPASF